VIPPPSLFIRPCPLLPHSSGLLQLGSKIESFNKQYETRKQWKQEQYQKHLEERGDFYSDKLTSIRQTNDNLLKEKVRPPPSLSPPASSPL
jgi:protoporphyrinogen oxidase